MKAYKYSRYIRSWHWSQDAGETLIYIPEAQALLYEGSGGGRQSYKGINTDSKFIEEAEDYISKINDGTVKKYSSDEHEDMNERFDQERKYSMETMILKDRTYIYEIPEKKIGTTTIMPVSLSRFEEVDINITSEGVKEIIDEQAKFSLEKAEFELSKKRFEENISNINNLITKK